MMGLNTEPIMQKTFAATLALALADALNAVVVDVLKSRARVFRPLTNPGPVRDMAREIKTATGLPMWMD